MLCMVLCYDKSCRPIYQYWNYYLCTLYLTEVITNYLQVTSRYHLLVPDLQIDYWNLTTLQDTMIIGPVMATRRHTILVALIDIDISSVSNLWRCDDFNLNHWHKKNWFGIYGEMYIASRILGLNHEWKDLIKYITCQRTYCKSHTLLIFLDSSALALLIPFEIVWQSLPRKMHV